MTIQVTCENPSCGKHLRVKEELAGKRVKCPACNGVSSVPSPTAEARGEGAVPTLSPPPAPDTTPAQEQNPVARVEKSPNRKTPEPGLRRTRPVTVAALGVLLLGMTVTAVWFFLQAGTLQQGLAESEEKAGASLAEIEVLKTALTTAQSQARDAATSQRMLTERLTDAEQKAKGAVARNAELSRDLAAAEKQASDAQHEAKEAAARNTELTRRLTAAEKQTADAAQQIKDLSQRLATAPIPDKGTKSVAETPTATGTDLVFKELPSLEKQGTSFVAYVLVFSPDGKTALSNSDDGDIFLWNTQTGTWLHRFVGHEGTGVSFLAFSSDGQRFLSAGQDGRVCIWDVKSRMELLKFEGHRNGETLKHQGKDLYRNSADRARFSPDDKFVLSFSRTHALLWDATTGKQVHRLNGEGDAFSRAIFSPDGRWILASMLKKSPPVTYELAVWDAQTGKEVRRLAGSFKDEHWIDTLAVTPSGKHLVACCRDQTIRTWEIESGKEIKRVPVTAKDRLKGFALARDGRLAITWEQKFAKKWTTRRTDFGGGRFEITATEAMMPDGDPTVHLWDVESGKKITSKAHKGDLPCVAFSPDGRQLLLGGEKQMQLWELVKAGK